MRDPRYLAFKIATSFIIAALGIIAFVRLALAVPFSGQTMTAYGIAAIIAGAGFWRGLIYLRAARAARAAQRA